jgi:hypothetical protein
MNLDNMNKLKQKTKHIQEKLLDIKVVKHADIAFAPPTNDHN